MGLRVGLALLTLMFASPGFARDALGFDAMRSGRYASSIDLVAYAPTADATPPSHRFEGRLQLHGKPSTRTLVANTEYLSRTDLAASKTWTEDFDHAFVQHEDVLIPAQRGPIRSNHGWWEVMLEPGRATMIALAPQPPSR
ncbi:MAG: hypothetical protein ACOH1P_12800 [Lysobacter sp.]